MKKRKGPADVPTNGGRWFLTYSDMITLLLALFLMLYSMSTVDAQKYKAIAAGFHSAFGTASGTGSGGGTALYYIPGVTTSSAVSSPLSGEALKSEDALTEVYIILEDYIKQNDLQNEIEVKDTGAYVQVHLKDIVLFNPNSATVLDSSKPILKEIEGALSKVYDRIDHITISGHTADVVVDPQNSDALSWQLSTERSVTVLNELIKNGLPENKLSIQGYAHYDPIATNSTTEGQAKNRRVEITIYKNPVVGTGATGRDKATLDSGAPSSSSKSPSSATTSGASNTPASTVPSAVPKH